MLKNVMRRFDAKGISVRVTDAVRDEVVRQGWHREYGARPLRRSIIRIVEDPLCDAILRQQVESGETVILDMDDSGAVVVRRPEETRSVNSKAELNDVVAYKPSSVRPSVDA